MNNPTYNATNKPLNLFGIDRYVFMVMLSVAILIFWKISFPIAIGIFFALFFAAQWATRRDRKFPQIWLARLKLAHLYDPGMGR